ncbi:MAG: DUF4185 domain-containing protein, partial [Armatimonadetes bacterium]|nr:DUF4185 domain-containing protein [Armatimonadota bacterium]
RLYRVTGEGIYRDSVLAGRDAPTRQPLLNAQVVGQDTVDNAIYRGQLFWIWGDTSRLSYPLGNFHTTAATSPLPGKEGSDPAKGVSLTYFKNEDGFTRKMTPFSDTGPTWLDGLVTLNEGGKERLFTLYSNVRQDMSEFERGLGRFNDAEGRFEKVAEFRMDSPILPRGHAFKAIDDGMGYIYFASPYPLVRVKADPKALRDLSQYEAFTLLQPGSRFDPDRPQEARLDRDESGRLRYGWKRDTSPVGPKAQDQLVEAGKMKREEALLQLQDPDTGAPVFAHRGSVYWNDYRQRWVMIATQAHGSSSYLGEVWYAEADTPVGPWAYARKVVTHNKYSFYNPKQHPYFDQDGGRRIYFEGTYTYTFSGTEEAATPRYDYNQIMYRLDLADPRLSLPLPVTLPRAEGKGESGGSSPAGFFAPDRPGPGLVPVYRRMGANGQRILAAGAPGDRGASGEEHGKPLFYALPSDAEKASPTTVPLYECVRESDGTRVYTTEPDRCPTGYRRADSPVCRVWRNPVRVDLSAFQAIPIPETR